MLRKLNPSQTHRSDLYIDVFQNLSKRSRYSNFTAWISASSPFVSWHYIFTWGVQNVCLISKPRQLFQTPAFLIVSPNLAVKLHMALDYSALHQVSLPIFYCLLLYSLKKNVAYSEHRSFLLLNPLPPLLTWICHACHYSIPFSSLRKLMPA